MSGTLTWSYTIATTWGEAGTVTFTSSDMPDSNGAYVATGVSGTWGGAGIVALEPSDGSGWAGADNLLSATATGFNSGLDSNGLSFTTTRNGAPLWVNLYSSGPGDFEVSEIDDPTQQNYTYYQSGPVASVTLSSTCYLRGTKILTAAGEVAIEDLRPGDRVVTLRGQLRAVQWIGQQSFLGRFLGAARAPVRIRAGALGHHAPRRDLVVSPDHSVMVDDALVHAVLLVNGVTITQAPVEGRVDYFHLDLGVHDCVMADGAWAESYAEQNNRNSFHNAASHRQAFPNHVPRWQNLCLPQIGGSDPGLAGLRGQIAARIPTQALSVEADVHLLADGARLNPAGHLASGWVFEIPAGTHDIRLISRASQPAALGLAADGRRLGLCVTGITAQTSTAAATLLPASPLLQQGFHAAEGPMRWTDGAAVLPALLLADRAEPVRLTITGHGLPHYLVATEAAALMPAQRHQM